MARKSRKHRAEARKERRSGGDLASVGALLLMLTLAGEMPALTGSILPSIPPLGLLPALDVGTAQKPQPKPQEKLTAPRKRQEAGRASR